MTGYYQPGMKRSEKLMLRVALVQHLRPEQKFDGLPAIRAQIAKDCQTARDILDAVAGGDVLDRPGRVGAKI